MVHSKFRFDKHFVLNVIVLTSFSLNTCQVAFSKCPEWPENGPTEKTKVFTLASSKHSPNEADPDMKLTIDKLIEDEIQSDSGPLCVQDESSRKSNPVSTSILGPLKQVLSLNNKNLFPSRSCNSSGSLVSTESEKDSISSEDPKQKVLEEIQNYASEMIDDDKYQKFDADQIDKTMRGLLEKAAEIEDQEVLKRHHTTTELEASLKRNSKRMAEALLVQGPFGLIGEHSAKGVRRAASGIAKSISKETLPTPSLDTNIRNLIPGSQFKLKAVQVGSGTALVLIGAGGIVAGAFTAGIAASALGVAGGALDVGSDVWISKFKRKNEFRKYLASELAKKGHSSDQKKHEKEEVEELMKEGLNLGFVEGSVNAAEHSGSVSDHSAEITVSLSEHVVHILPFVGASYQLTRGLKKIMDGMMTSEVGYQSLLAYENAFQTLVDGALKRRKAEVRAALRKARSYARREGSLIEDPQFMSNVHCLCTADQWLMDTQQKADGRFKDRIAFLEQKHDKKIQEEDRSEALKRWASELPGVKDVFSLDENRYKKHVAKLERLKDRTEKENQSLGNDIADLQSRFDKLVLSDQEGHLKKQDLAENLKLAASDYMRHVAEKIRIDPNEIKKDEHVKFDESKIKDYENLLNRTKAQLEKANYQEHRRVELLNALNEQVVREEMLINKTRTKDLKKDVNFNSYDNAKVKFLDEHVLKLQSLEDPYSPLNVSDASQIQKLKEKTHNEDVKNKMTSLEARIKWLEAYNSERTLLQRYEAVSSKINRPGSNRKSWASILSGGVDPMFPAAEN